LKNQSLEKCNARCNGNGARLRDELQRRGVSIAGPQKPQLKHLLEQEQDFDKIHISVILMLNNKNKAKNTA
jgi:hypothetical protein